MAKTTTVVPDLRVWDNSKCPPEARPPRLPKALIRGSAHALRELQQRIFGIEDFLGDKLTDAIFYQAYLERGKKLMMLHHLKALQGCLDKEKLEQLRKELHSVVDFCAEHIYHENSCVKYHNSQYGAALAARKKELEGAQ